MSAWEKEKKKNNHLGTDKYYLFPQNWFKEKKDFIWITKCNLALDS